MKGKYGKAYLHVPINSTIVTSQLPVYVFLKFLSLPSEINHWCNQVKRQNGKDGFNVFLNALAFRITINFET